MNQQAYRVIFSKVRSCFIAVAEIKHQCGKQKSTSSTATESVERPTQIKFSLFWVVIASAFGSICSINIANAQMVAYKNGAAIQPTIDHTANGHTLVQITAPNASGLSHNKYDQFNVDANGIILNNSAATTATQLAGFIQGNPNLNAGRGANVILNEVMTTNRSLLNGYIEVAGQRADVIVANPNGITIGNGAGFLNAARGVLTTGTPAVNGDGSLNGFRVTKGDITVASGGANGSGLSQLDLIARSVTLNDSIWANKLNIVAGANQVNYANLGLQSISGEGNKPTVGIDSSALGGMYAEKITLVGTEAGVGVRLLGNMASTDGDITINSRGQIQLLANISARGRIDLQSDDAITNTGTLAARQNLTLHAASINSSGTLAAGVNDQGQAALPGNLELTATGQISATGQNTAGNDIHISGTSLNLAHANTDAGGSINLDATNGAINHDDATLKVSGTIQISGADMQNQGGQIIGNRSVTLQLTGDLLNQQGLIYSAQAQTITAQNIDNSRGALVTANSLQLQSDKLNNNGGTISTDELQIKSVVLQNQAGNIYGNTAVDITTTSLVNDNAGYIGGNLVNLKASAVSNRLGKIEALQDGLHIKADSLNNGAGVIQNLGDSGMIIDISQSLNNGPEQGAGGFIGSLGDLTVNGAGIENSSGTLYAKHNLQLASNGDFNNAQGVVQSDGALILSAANAINNQSGKIEANGVSNGNALQISAASLNNADGRIASSTGGNMSINTNLLTNTNGTVGSNGQLSLTANTINNQHGQFIAAGDMNVSMVSRFANNNGSIYGANSVTFLPTGATLDNTQGSISSQGQLVFTLGSLVNNQGRISHVADDNIHSSNVGNNIAINTSGTLANSAGTIASGHDLTINANALTGEGTAMAANNTAIKLKGDFTNTAGQLISANNVLQFTVSGDLFNLGTFSAQNGLILHANNITNTGLINAWQTSVIAQGQLDNYGRIYGDYLSVGAYDLHNEANAVIGARADLQIGAQQITNQDHALITSLGDIVLGGAINSNFQSTGNANTVTNSQATFDAGGFLTFNAQTLNNLNPTFATEWVKTGENDNLVEYAFANPGGDLVWHEGTLAKCNNGSGAGTLACTGNNKHHWVLYFEGFGSAYFWQRIYNQIEYSQVVTSTDPGQIYANRDIILNVANVNNNASVILAGGQNIGIGAGFDNSSSQGQIRYERVGAVSPDVGDGGRDTAGLNYHYLNGSNDKWQGVTNYAETIAGLSYDLNIWPSGTAPVRLTNPAYGNNPGNNVIPGGSSREVGNNSNINSITGKTQTIATPDQAIPNLTLPGNQLFIIHTQPGTNYLIETDPAFTNYSNFISSDYLLTRLNINPQATLSRLGDGYYEQKLINDQLTQLTGRRLLDGYASVDQQYQGLMTAGVTVAEAMNLSIGIGLSAQQVAALTSDIVWLVSQKVTLPDGSKKEVLVPVVYLSQLTAPDVQPSGAIFSGASINLNYSGNVNNSGTIQATNNLIVNANNISNNGNLLSSSVNAQNPGQMILTANQNINSSGQINGNRVAVLAGNDITIQSVTQTLSSGDSRNGGSNTSITQVAGVTANQLIMQSGHDINLNAANINVQGDALMQAANNLNLGTVTLAQSDIGTLGSSHISTSQTRDVGTQIQSQGTLTLAAGNDLNAKAAYANSDGQMMLVAGHDINLGTGKQQTAGESETHTTSHGFLSSTQSDSFASTNHIQNIGSTFSGDSVQAVAGHDINVTGSNVVATQNTTLMAANNVTVEASQDTMSSYTSSYQHTSGLMGNGGIGITYGTQSLDNTTTAGQVSHNASTIGTTNGNTNIIASNQYTQAGSNVMSLTDDVNIQAKSILLTAVQDTYDASNQSHAEQNGLTLSITAPIVSALQTTHQLASAASQTDDPRMKAMAVASAGKTLYDNVGAAMDKPKDGVSLSLSYGSSHSDSQSTSSTSSAVGSSVTAGGKINLLATGAGENSNITVIGSEINSKSGGSIYADNQFNLLAAVNTQIQQGSNSSSGGSIGVAVTYSGKGGMAAGITASGYLANGNSNGSNTSYSNAHIGSNGLFDIRTGGDMNVIGGTLTGSQITGNIGGNLNIQSLQDSSTYISKNQGLGGSVTIGAGFAGSVNYNNSRVNGNYLSTGEQSGVFAGDGGYQLSVNGNTSLTGGVIASTAAAENNFLITQTLTQQDLKNTSSYNATGVSLGTGFGKVDSSKGGTIQSFFGSISGTAAGISNENGTISGFTGSGISAGTIVIRDETRQLQLTGQTADQTIANINHDIIANAGSLTKTWDGQQLNNQVNAQAQITAAFSQQANQIVADYAKKERTDLQQKLKAASTPEEQQALQNKINEINLQENVLNVLIGAVSGSPGIAVTRETLSAAADRMRLLMVEDSKKFPGVTDGVTTVTNASAKSVGVKEDEFKLGGTRIDLDALCGLDNSRCLRHPDGSLKLNVQGQVQFSAEGANGLSLQKYLDSKEGQDMGGFTGGIQGAKGTLNDHPYSPYSWQDQLIEAYAGTHDMLGGKASGLYDNKGNAEQGRSALEKNAQNAWSATGAIVVSTPFAMAELLPPEVWKAISIFVENIR